MHHGSIIIAFLPLWQLVELTSCPEGLQLHTSGLCYFISNYVSKSNCDVRRECYELQQSRIISSFERDSLKDVFGTRATKVLDHVSFYSGSSHNHKDFYVGGNLLVNRYSRLGIPMNQEFSKNCFTTANLGHRVENCASKTVSIHGCVYKEGRYSMGNLGHFVEASYPVFAAKTPVGDRGTCVYDVIDSPNITDCLIRCYRNAACVSVYYSKQLKKCHPILYVDTTLPPSYKSQAALYQRYRRIRN